MNDNIKYRPHLNGKQVNKIVELCNEAEQDNTVISLLTIMIPLQLKIQSGMIKPAATTQGRVKLNDNINSISYDTNDSENEMVIAFKKEAAKQEAIMLNDSEDKKNFTLYREGKLT